YGHQQHQRGRGQHPCGVAPIERGAIGPGGRRQTDGEDRDRRDGRVPQDQSNHLGSPYSASSFLSPVRMGTACSMSNTKILPSPMRPVAALLRIVSTTRSTRSLGTAISSLIFGTKFTAYSAPR